jgi:CHAD domain-containing protein
MNEPPSILKSWDEQTAIFYSNLTQLRQRPTRKAVHDIRVAIKKLRSYLRLRQALNSEPWSESFSTIKFLFQTLAKQRDLEISLTLLAHYLRHQDAELSHFKKFLQANCRLTKKWSKDASINFDVENIAILTKSVQASFSAIPVEEINNKTKVLAERTIRKVRKLAGNFRKNIHPIRKELKDLMYWIKACPDAVPADLYPVKILDKILTNLGKWQDFFIFLEKLKHYRKEYVVKSGEEYSWIRRCEEDARKSQTVLLLKIKSSLGIFLS